MQGIYLKGALCFIALSRNIKEIKHSLMYLVEIKVSTSNYREVKI